MPCSWMDAFSAFQSSCVGIAMFASSNSEATRWVAGVHACSVYLSKNSPDAYFESRKPSNVSPVSIAMLFEARRAWNSTV